jgi:hypothetical protein
VDSSSSFAGKTEFSQAKYLRRKQEKCAAAHLPSHTQTQTQRGAQTQTQTQRTAKRRGQRRRPWTCASLQSVLTEWRGRGRYLRVFTVVRPTLRTLTEHYFTKNPSGIMYACTQGGRAGARARERCALTHMHAYKHTLSLSHSVALCLRSVTVWTDGLGRGRDMRLDALAHMLSQGNVRAGARLLVVDDCLGLLAAACLERLGGARAALARLANTHTTPCD